MPTVISFNVIIYSLSEKWILSTSVTTYFYLLSVWDVGCFFEGFCFGFFVFFRLQSRVKHLCQVLKIWRTYPKCMPVWWIYTIHLPATGWKRMRSCCHLIDIPSSMLVFKMKRHYFNMNTCRQNSPFVLIFKIKIECRKGLSSKIFFFFAVRRGDWGTRACEL